MNQIEIAQTFSLGQLNQTFKYFSEAMVWDIVGEKKLIGQADVIAECIQVQYYFNSVEHDFKIDQIYPSDQSVIIRSQSCFRSQTGLKIISACNIYELKNDQIITKITSYCIIHA